ncbi:MAG: DUF6044 family protein [Bacteroidota bacterium]
MKLKNSHILSNEKALIRLSMGIILLYFSPYLIYGEDAPLQILDNLDSSLAWVQILLNQGLLFPSPDTSIQQVFNGLPASAVYPYYDLSLIFFRLLGVFWGYIFNKILMSVLGFWGMFFLLKKHVLRESNFPLLYVGPSLLFALLPFWSYMGSVSLLPALFYAFLNLYTGKNRWYNWGIITLYAFYSSLILSGIFVLLLLGLIFLYVTIRYKKIKYTFGFALIYLSLCYLISHYPLMHAFFGEGGFISHRTEFYLSPHGWKYALEKSMELFVAGNFHAYSIQPLLILPILGLFWVKRFRQHIGTFYLAMLLFLMLSSLLHGFKESYTLKPFIDAFTEIFPIHVHRFLFLHPPIWHVLLAIALGFMYQHLRKGKELCLLIIGLQLIILFACHGFVRFSANPSYRDFVNKEGFDEIKHMINKPLESYRVISVGMLPSSSQFNGFHTLDGYFPNYPLSYKHEFRKIIADELEREALIKKHYDDWGSSAYAFSAERKVDFFNNHPPPIQKLAYNFEAFKQMGGAYIFSAAKIELDQNPELSLVGIVKEDFWEIHVYQVN